MADGHKGKAIHSGTEDIISDLPSNIIDCILEHMPIPDAARMSILSRNWRFIWATHPQLVLDKKFFGEIIRDKLLTRKEFMGVITKILSLHNGPILKCSLYIPKLDVYHNLEIDQWILFLSKNVIKELTLHNANRNPYQLPSTIFSCPELTRLVLNNFVFKPPHVSEGFGNLICLYLKRTSFAANFLGASVVSAPLLKHLTFAACYGINHFRFHAPKLEVFSVIDGRDVELICFKRNPNLKAVTLTLHEVGNHRQDESINFIDLFGDLARIQTLAVDGFFLKYLAAGTIPKRLSTTLNHLKLLRLYELGFDDVQQITCTLCLLRSSPNLKMLDISDVMIMHNDLEPTIRCLETPYCIDQTLDQLQTIRIRSSKGLRTELLFIKLLLACSPSLEKMIVELSSEVDAEEGFRISREIMQFFRASPEVEMVYSRATSPYNTNTPSSPLITCCF